MSFQFVIAEIKGHTICFYFVWNCVNFSQSLETKDT